MHLNERLRLRQETGRASASTWSFGPGRLTIAASTIGERIGRSVERCSAVAEGTDGRGNRLSFRRGRSQAVNTCNEKSNEKDVSPGKIDKQNNREKKKTQKISTKGHDDLRTSRCLVATPNNPAQSKHFFGWMRHMWL